MAEWTGEKVDKSLINNGQQYVDGDGLRAEDVNAIVNNSLYASEKAEETYDKVDVFETRIEKLEKNTENIITSNGVTRTTNEVIIEDSNLKVNGNIIINDGEINHNVLDELNEKANTTDVYTKSETNTLLNKKADLVDGKIPVEQIPTSGTIVEVAKKVIYKDEEKTIEEVLEAEETNYMSATIECNHEKEITGNTGDEHGLAINDQQMLITKIQGQTRRKSLNLFNGSRNLSDWNLVAGNTYTITTIDGTHSIKIAVNWYSSGEEVLIESNKVTFTYNTNKNWRLFIDSASTQEQENFSDYGVMCVEGSTALPYEPYDNTLVNSKCDFVSTGKNLWDEEWEVGNIDNGVNVSASNRIRSKNYIKVLPNETYTYGGNSNTINIIFFNNETQLSYVSLSQNQTFTTPTNCNYIRFTMSTSYGTTYQNDIAICYGTSGDYEPYLEDTMLCGLELGAFDYHDNISNKTHKQTSEIITLTGSDYESWKAWSTKDSTKPRFAINISEIGANAIFSNTEITIASTFINRNATETWDCLTGICIGDTNNNVGIYIEGITTVEELKTWLQANPITFVYKLANETTETNVLPSGYSVYNGGMQIQKTNTIPYTLTKQYSLSISSQILANISIDKDQQAQIDKVKEQINSINDKKNEVLLWENGKADIAFSSQTITISGLSSYKYIVIGVKLHYDVYGDENVDYAIQYFKFNKYTGEFGLSINDYSRNGSINSSNQIYFENANNNDYIIPVEIYGTNTL